MVKLVINATDKVMYLPRNNVVIDGNGISTLDGKGVEKPIRVYRVNSKLANVKKMLLVYVTS